MKVHVEGIPFDPTWTYGHIHFNVPTQYEIDKAYDYIKDECYVKLDEKYGNWEAAKQRLEGELYYLKRADSAFHMMIAKLASDLSKTKHCLMYEIGGDGIIDYLLGISPVDPMPPHYYCNDCQYFEIADNVADGFDLPQKICSHCGKKMHRDGHDCSKVWRSKTRSPYFLAGRGSYEYHNELQLAMPIVNELQSYLDAHLSGCEADSERYLAVSYVSREVHNRLAELSELTGKSPLEISVYDVDVWRDAVRLLLHKRKSDLYEDVSKFSTFSQLLRLVGLNFMSEDHGKIEKTADMALNLEYQVFLDETSNDDRIYRWSKSACIQTLFMCYYRVWYKNNFPDEYEKIFGEHGKESGV